MDSNYLSKALIGTAGMAIGAALVTLLRVAAVDGVERARERHVAEVAAASRPNAAVAARAGIDCPCVAGAH